MTKQYDRNFPLYPVYNMELSFNAGPPMESIFLTTIYGLYFSHHYTYKYKLHFLHEIEFCSSIFFSMLPYCKQLYLNKHAHTYFLCASEIHSCSHISTTHTTHRKPNPFQNHTRSVLAKSILL